MLRAGNEIHLLMKDTNKKLKVSQGLPDWKSYLDFVNDIIVGGLKKIVRSRRFEVLRCLHAIFMNRLQERMSWLVSLLILRPFGPNRDAPRRS